MKKWIITVLLTASLIANSQEIHRNQWSVQPKIGTSSIALWGIANTIEDAILGQVGIYKMSIDQYSEFWSRNSWYIPEFVISQGVYSISSADGAKIEKPYWWREILIGDYSHTFKFSAGYELGWKSLTTPFGVYLGVNWEFFQLALRDCAENGKHRSQAIVPSAGIRFRLWSAVYEKSINPAIEIGGAYIYNFKYHGPNGYGIDAINNGLRGKVAAGVDFPNEHTAIFLEYSHNFFNHFNKDFEVNGSKPFADYKNTFGDLSIRLSHSF